MPRKPGEVVDKVATGAPEEAPLVEGAEVFEALIMDEDLPGAVKEMMDAGYTSEQIKAALEKNYANRKKAEVVEGDKVAPVGIDEEVRSQIADAKAELKDAEEVSGPKTFEELIDAMGGQAGDGYDRWEYNEDVFYNVREFEKLVVDIKELEARRGKKYALEHALKDSILENLNEKNRGMAIKIIKREYDVPETPERQKELEKQEEIEESMQQAINESGAEYYLRSSDVFGDYDWHLSRAQSTLESSKTLADSSEEAPKPALFDTWFRGGRAFNKSNAEYANRELSRRAAKINIPKLEVLIEKLEVIKEKYENKKV